MRASTVDFSPYDVILIRKPFGASGIIDDTGGSGSETRRDVPARDLRMCGIAVGPAGLLVGIVDTATGRSYLLRVGESEDGIGLVDADYDGECAVLRRGNEVRSIGMRGEATGAPRPSAAGGVPRSAPPEAASPVSSTGRGLYSERVRRSRGTVRINTNQPPAMSGEDLERNLQEYNLKVIRDRGASGPALPIALTPEQDAQLVAEGVLPAQE